MARLSQGPAIGSTAPAAGSADVAFAELGQLLSRLQQNLLHPNPERERRLRASEYERAKVESNLEYARSLLTKLEQDALSAKAPARRLERQAALNTQRDTLETLLDRLEDLRQLAVDDEDSSDEEDLLSNIVPTPSESMDSRSSDARESSTAEPTPPEGSSTPEPAPAPAQLPTLSQPSQSPPPATEAQTSAPTTTALATPPTYTPQPQPSTQTTQTMRARSSQAPASSAHTTARAALFANRRKPAEPHTSTATAEAILDHQRGEQDALSESTLKMAGALKASSQKFSTTLDADKDVVSRAGDGINKTEQSMEAARGRMGMLTKMTEGKGWWGRMILYAWVYGLMVGLVLIVFVMPKLRF